MSKSEIIETLIKAQKYVKSRGGQFTAKISIYNTEIIDIQVYFKRKPRSKERNFGISTHLLRLDELQEGLEMLLDKHFGTAWREQE